MSKEMPPRIWVRRAEVVAGGHTIPFIAADETKTSEDRVPYVPEKSVEEALSLARKEAETLFKAMDRFIEVTQERSKAAGHNRMLAPEEYVAMLYASVEYQRARASSGESGAGSGS